MQSNFFSNSELSPPLTTMLAPGAILLHNFIGDQAAEVVAAIEKVSTVTPFRHMSTPGGFRMSVAMTNCGQFGWVTDRKGYRYSAIDPETGQQWPSMPSPFQELCRSAATLAGYPAFEPDACLINRYEPGARMTLHQDKDEANMESPIVSVSLGLPAVFQLGGPTRKEKPARYQLQSGDVVVWGGPSRLNFHGVAALRAGDHPLTGSYRYNLTFRRAC